MNYLPPATPDLATFQARVEPWLEYCFTKAIALDRFERNSRFIEESLELVQACGMSFEQVIELATYVFKRKIGERYQEVGGVIVTLVALCSAWNIALDEAAETELTRIWAKADEIRKKHLSKPKNSVLPASMGADPDHDDIVRDIAEQCATLIEAMIIGPEDKVLADAAIAIRARFVRGHVPLPVQIVDGRIVSPVKDGGVGPSPGAIRDFIRLAGGVASADSQDKVSPTPLPSRSITKPDDIPQDVWQEALIRVGTSDHVEMHATWIARAIMAERARCLAIARQVAEDSGDTAARGLMALEERARRDAGRTILKSIEAGANP